MSQFMCEIWQIFEKDSAIFIARQATVAARARRAAHTRATTATTTAHAGSRPSAALDLTPEATAAPLPDVLPNCPGRQTNLKIRSRRYTGETGAGVGSATQHGRDTTTQRAHSTTRTLVAR